MNLQLSIKKSFSIILGLVILVLGIGCENKTIQTPKPQVVGQKIQMNSPDGSKPADSENDVESKTIQVQEMEADHAGIIEQENGDAKDLTAMVMSDYASIWNAEVAKIPDFYNPESKIDPFMPLFRDGPKEEIEISQKVERERRVPRTPLERIDLSQLKLVGIIQASGGNKGLVQEASGKGYIISMGTYMGTHGGRVVNIANDRVIVEEEVDDVLGKLTLQKRELKLQKPFGEN
jgi:Tfp pilus assembly protein PilP